MVKKRGITTIVIAVLILSGLNIFLFFNKKGFSYASISGRFVKEIPELPMNINISLIAFIAQWIILILIIVVAYVHLLRHRKDDEYVKRDYSLLKQKKTKSGTDLDILYNLLQNKKRLSTKTISELFGIPKEKALEWAKILENSKLAVVEYPTFNDPEVRTYEEEIEKQEQGKEEGQKQIEKGAGDFKQQKPTVLQKEQEKKEKQGFVKPTKRIAGKRTNKKVREGKLQTKKPLQKTRRNKKFKERGK